MPKLSVLTVIKQLQRPIFTTRELSASGTGSLSNTTQVLNYLVSKGIVVKIARGLWGLEIGDKKIGSYALVPFLVPNHRAYVSFISALHLYGIIEQIPQVITLASTSHTRIVKTKMGTFFIHRIAPSFFKGFDWYKGNGNFLIAGPEKALIDCLYLSVRKKKQFSYFPELHIPKSFSFNKAQKWAKDIPYIKIRSSVLKKLAKIKMDERNKKSC